MVKIEPTVIFLVVSVVTLLIERIFYYRSKYSHKKNNPVNLDRFYQEFKDFKDIYFKEWKKSVDKKLEELEKRRK